MTMTSNGASDPLLPGRDVEANQQEHTEGDGHEYAPMMRCPKVDTKTAVLACAVSSGIGWNDRPAEELCTHMPWL